MSRKIFNFYENNEIVEHFNHSALPKAQSRFFFVLSKLFFIVKLWSLDNKKR